MTLRSGREEIGIKKASRFDVGLFYAEVQKQFARSCTKTQELN